MIWPFSFSRDSGGNTIDSVLLLCLPSWLSRRVVVRVQSVMATDFREAGACPEYLLVSLRGKVHKASGAWCSEYGLLKHINTNITKNSIKEGGKFRLAALVRLTHAQFGFRSQCVGGCPVSDGPLVSIALVCVSFWYARVVYGCFITITEGDWPVFWCLGTSERVTKEG